jgi:hypothetical protein
MGTPLTGLEIRDTYDALLKITDNGPLSGTAKYLSDGLGNDSALALSTGDIGIGTTSPQRPLHINATEGVLRLTSTASGNDGLEIGIGTSSQGFLWLAENSYMQFATNNAERMRIDSSGNVGIGTDAATSKLHISAPDALSSWDSALPLVNVTNLDQTNGQGFALLARGGSLDANCNIFEVQDYSANSKFVVKGLGNVGIGTDAPTAILDVRGAATQFRVGISAGGFVELSDNQVAAKTSAAAASDLYLNVSGANTILNRDSGNVGIQNSAPDVLLAVGATTSTVNVPAMKIFRGGATSHVTTYGYSGNAIVNAVGTDYVMQREGTEVARFTTAGLCFGGDFLAANALDDYEEGTWTMGISFGGASVGVTTSSNTGNYTKIGRQVTVNGIVVLTSKGSSTGSAKITGLPFTIGSGLPNFAVASLRIEAITFANQFQALGSVASTNIELEEVTEAGINTTLSDADFANNSTIMISFTYFV